MLGMFTRMIPLAVLSAAGVENGDEIQKMGGNLFNIANNLKASTEMRQIAKSIRLDLISGEEMPDLSLIHISEPTRPY